MAQQITMNIINSSILSLLLAGATLCHAESNGILANTDTFRPKITISDSYVERLAVPTFTALAAAAPAALPREKVAVTIVSNVEGIDPLNVSPDTVVRVQIGDLTIVRTLSDDPFYKIGRKQAVFPLFAQTMDPRPKLTGRLTCAWTARRLTLTLTCSDLDETGLPTIMARDFAGAAAANTSVKVEPKPVCVDVAFGDFAGRRTAYLRGSTLTQTQHLRDTVRGGYSEIDLVAVRLLGAADTHNPLVSPKVKGVCDAQGTLTLSGFVADSDEIWVNVTVNDGETPVSAIRVGEPGANGQRTWCVEGIQLTPGQNVVTVSFRDPDANQSVLTKRFWVQNQQ